MALEGRSERRELRGDRMGSMPLARKLVYEWQRALGGDIQSRAQWQVAEGGKWTWESEGVHARGAGSEWSGLIWQRCGTAALRELKNFVIELTVSGKAAAAGFSFGGYKDFLTSLEPARGARRLQLEVDVEADRWAFRVDGQLMQRCWWDSAIHSTADIVNGALTLKGRGTEDVLFQELAIDTFEASCQLSVIITCYRFLQRLRVSLHNWCNQDIPQGAYEVLVVNPASPDGTHEYLATIASSYPHVRIREVAVESALATNKGKMINRAVAVSRGEWIWLTDADVLFSPTCVAKVLAHLKGQRQYLFYGQRRYLSTSQTNALLSGRINGLAKYELLTQSSNPRGPDNAPWGYTQIVHRSVIERIHYREDVNHFAHTDMVFAQDCRRRNVLPRQVPGLVGLHMDHPFSWYGTQIFL
jgi:hypothetical protein